MDTFKKVCHEIGMPILPDKSVGPVQVIKFLGLTINSVLMVVWVPDDKLQDIRNILTTMIKKWKATGYELESLAGKLNFISRIISARRSFIQRIYQVQIGIKKKLHIDLKALVLQDLHMWRTFLSKFRGWNPIVDMDQLSRHPLEVVADAAGSAHLGWGTWLPHTGHWIYGQWETEVFDVLNLSLDFLELYALLVLVVMWAPILMDHVVLFRSDNTPAVYALINKASSIDDMMLLIHYITLFCMTHNIKILAKHVKGTNNKFCHLLSQFKFQEFHKTKPENTRESPSIPDTWIYPLSVCMQKVWCF